MINKVEICGVNTSKLPLLSREEKQELFIKIKEGNEEARNTFINGNLRLVLSVIQRFYGRGESADDLFQVGCVGLIKAIDNFDLSQNVQFSTYAVPMIIGEVKRYLRDNNSIRVSRSIRDLAYKAIQFKEKYTKEKGKEPSIEEIAKGLGVEKEEVAFSFNAIQDPISLQEPVYNDGSESIFVIEQVKDNKNTDELWAEKMTINVALEKLSTKEKAKKIQKILEEKEIICKFEEKLNQTIIVKSNESIVTISVGKLSSGFECHEINQIVISADDLIDGEKKRKRIMHAAFKEGEKVVFADLKIGDYVVHKKYGIGIYIGVNTIKADNTIKDYIKIKYKNLINENKMSEKNNYENINLKLGLIQSKINDTQIEIHKLKLEKESVEPRLDKLAQIEEQLNNNYEKLNNLNNLNDSMEYAKNILEKSFEKMKNSVTPKFTNNLSETISQIFNNKYSKVKFNEENGLIVELENGDYVPADRLSIGTIDQLYLSLRISMIDELSEEKLPLFLDESFAYYDNNRLENALKYITNNLESRQTLIFTCANREKEILDKMGITYNYIEI